MIFISILLCLQGVAFEARANDVDFCESDLTRVDPMAADPYERLGVHEGIQSTQLTMRFRAAMAHYRDNPSDLSRLASAYAQVRLDYASGARFDDSPLPVATLRRAHGRIYGDPLGGRFTVGYSLNRAGMPEMDYSIMMRDVLNTPAARKKLLALPKNVRPVFEEVLKYFGKEIRRLGLEGGFEDVVVAQWTLARGMPREVVRPAMKLFVELFGRIYREAQADPGGPEEKNTRQVLKGIKFPPEIERGPLIQQLQNERDPRTFLRKTVTHLRAGESGAENPSLEALADLYAQSFLVEPAQFLQHLLLFATDQWTTRVWDLHGTEDRAAIRRIMNLLRELWIERPLAEDGEPQLFDYASVLYDANQPITKVPFSQPQSYSPLWVELDRFYARYPHIREQFEAERSGRTIPSDVLPW